MGLHHVHNLGRLQPRVIEHHLVSPGGSLSDKFHFDGGSLVTVDVMLSIPEKDFTGGAFCTSEGNDQYEQHLFERGDAVVFPAHKYHFVNPVTAGLREVMVMEL